MSDDHQSLDELLDQARHPGEMPGEPTSGQPPPALRPPRGRSGLSGAFGCLRSLIVLGLFVGGIFFIVRLAMTGSGAYQGAVEAAQSDPQVIAALGEPVEPGWWVLGSIETSGLSGEATLTIPIHGPDARGTLNVGARKQNGVWTFYTLALRVNQTGEVIVLND